MWQYIPTGINEKLDILMANHNLTNVEHVLSRPNIIYVANSRALPAVYICTINRRFYSNTFRVFNI
jgi:hypothetical protein